MSIARFSVHISVPAYIPTKHAHLSSLDDILLPNNSISLVRVCLSGAKHESEVGCLLVGPFECEQGQHPEVMTPTSIIDPNLEELWIDIMIPSNNPIHVKQNCPLA